MLEEGTLELNYQKRITMSELWKLQETNPDLAAKVVIPEGKDEKPWYMVKHKISPQWIFSTWPKESARESGGYVRQQRHIAVELCLRLASIQNEQKWR